MIKIYNIKKDERIFLWDLYKNDGEGHASVKKMFENEKEFIEWAAKRNDNIYPWKKSDMSNTIFENINLTGNDKIVIRGGLYNEKKEFIRQYVLTDSSYRILDPENYKEEIEKVRRIEEKKNPLKPISYCVSHIEKTVNGWKWKKGMPVPFTGKTRYNASRRYSYVRSKKEYENPETKEYMRNGAVVPDPWINECFERTQKCWKDQKKVRRQWQKGPCKDRSNLKKMIFEENVEYC